MVVIVVVVVVVVVLLRGDHALMNGTQWYEAIMHQCMVRQTASVKTVSYRSLGTRAAGYSSQPVNFRVLRCLDEKT